MLIAACLLLLIGMGLAVVLTDKLVTCVLIAAGFSALSALVFLLVGAPDVALAEIAIGSTLSTIIYLVALQRYKVFSIFYIVSDPPSGNLEPVLDLIDKTMQAREAEPHRIQSRQTAAALLQQRSWDLIVEDNGEKIVIYAEESSSYVEKIKGALAETGLGQQVILWDTTRVTEGGQ